MNSKILNSLSVLCLLAIIAVMSWRDMHPRIEIRNSPVVSLLTYYAGPDITADMVPDDGRPLTIDAGDFSYAPDGKTVWTPHGMLPTTFAQRQMILQFNFNSLPQNPVQTIEKIQAVADEWMRKGDTINTFIFNYSPAKVDLKAYKALLQAAYDKFSKKSPLSIKRYLVFASINIQWGSEALKALQEDSPRFLVHLPQTHISQECLSKLAALKYNLILQYPAGTRVEDIDISALQKLSSLSSITLALDPRRPLLKKEEKVGLFPKF